MNESLLDDEDDLMDKGAKAADLRQVWEELTKTYGETLCGASRGAITIDNIDFDSKNRIVFKNWPGNTVTLYLGWGGIPDCFKEHGFGDLPANITKVVIQEFRGKLSSLGFDGNYKNCELELDRGNYEMDKFPKFSTIQFLDCNFKNVLLLPKKQPKNTRIFFSETSQANLFGCWSYYFFKGNYARWSRNGQEIIT